MVDKPNKETNEVDALVKLLAEKGEIDVVLAGTPADFVGRILLVKETLPFLDKPLDVDDRLNLKGDPVAVGDQTGVMKLCNVDIKSFGEVKVLEIFYESEVMVKPPLESVVDEPVA